MRYRIEHDTMGEVQVPADKYWGAQTQRSFNNFDIGRDHSLMPKEIIRAFAVLKMAAAKANNDLGVLSDRKKEIICEVCHEILEGKLDEHFPLVVYQTGSGTQSNMNVNEVIANRGNEIAGEKLLHPNDDVNKSQSSNDTFPTAMHISANEAIRNKLIPALNIMKDQLIALEKENADVVKTGRTHLQDAVPLTLGQEISGWRSMLEHSEEMILGSAAPLEEMALGATAVGTGLNAPEGFDVLAAKYIKEKLDGNYITAKNKFHSLTSKDGLVFAHGAMKALAADLMKIANDVRWLASGPRCGIGELIIPENEPGSSIMPGKVNPTQCEALTMVCAQVMGNDATIGFAASQGNFELNVFMPVMAYDFLESADLLAGAMRSFTANCLSGLKPNKEKIAENLDKSLMLVTALNTHIGYENAAKIAKKAHKEGSTLKEAALALGLVSEADFNAWVDPAKMV
ncbi:MAG: class II fumarate hydratase [Firmicutes bacterium]|nr:class II fumarate hydratase [Bacillota bacterium]